MKLIRTFVSSRRQWREGAVVAQVSLAALHRVQTALRVIFFISIKRLCIAV